jgi:hypothetical protein
MVAIRSLWFVAMQRLTAVRHHVVTAASLNTVARSLSTSAQAIGVSVVVKTPRASWKFGRQSSSAARPFRAMSSGASAQQSSTYTVVIESAKKNDASQVYFSLLLCCTKNLSPCVCGDFGTSFA